MMRRTLVVFFIRLSVIVISTMLISSCSNTSSFIGKCYKPFIFAGRTIRVDSCLKSSSMFNSSYCLITVKTELGTRYIDTIQLDRLKDSIQVSCEEFKK